MRKNKTEVLGSSFKDPSGFVFMRQGVVWRQVNRVYKSNYEMLMKSGLYDELVGLGLMVGHKEVREKPVVKDRAYRVIRPEQVKFVSYPYEWCFGQLKEAALVTLLIQKKAMEREMSLKDASAFNIQFVEGKLKLIDSLSFEEYEEGKPWVAYRQFCEQFLAPLALMIYRDGGLGRLSRAWLGGVPLEVVRKLLPMRTWLKSGLGVHLQVHGVLQGRQNGLGIGVKERVSRRGVLGLVESLETSVRGLKLKTNKSGWSDYCEGGSYTKKGWKSREKLVEGMLGRVRPKTVWDLGANTGVFSKLAAKKGARVVAFDSDHVVVEQFYNELKMDGEGSVLPLVMDLLNPSPSLGWAHKERLSLVERGPIDMVLALALVHHLAIGGNVPLGKVAEFFGGLGKWLVVEFVPKSDKRVKEMLECREDVFGDYSLEGFEREFGELFEVVDKRGVVESGRQVYLMRRK